MRVTTVLKPAATLLAAYALAACGAESTPGSDVRSPVVDTSLLVSTPASADSDKSASDAGNASSVAAPETTSDATAVITDQPADASIDNLDGDGSTDTGDSGEIRTGNDLQYFSTTWTDLAATGAEVPDYVTDPGEIALAGSGCPALSAATDGQPLDHTCLYDVAGLWSASSDRLDDPFTALPVPYLEYGECYTVELLIELGSEGLPADQTLDNAYAQTSAYGNGNVYEIWFVPGNGWGACRAEVVNVSGNDDPQLRAIAGLMLDDLKALRDYVDAAR